MQGIVFFLLIVSGRSDYNWGIASSKQERKMHDLEVGKMKRIAFLFLFLQFFCNGAITYDYENNRCIVDGDSQLIIDDGWDWHTYLYENASVYITGSAFVTEDIQCNDGSDFIMDGGEIYNRVTISDGGLATITGGFFRSSVEYGWAAFEAHGGSQVTMSNVGFDGNDFQDEFICGGYGTVIQIFGSAFLVDNIEVGSGIFTSLYGGAATNDPPRQLRGFSDDGDSMAFSFQIGQTSQIILNPIPEPYTVLLLAFGGLLIRKRLTVTRYQ